MELLIGEAERTRAILHYVKAVPRFCDIHSIHQSSKFELSEMEDNRQNRMNILNSLINDAMKEVSLQYVQNISSEQITKLKNEFIKNKAFMVSQVALGGKKSDLAGYDSQLANFPILKQVLNKTVIDIKDEQKLLVERAKLLGIKTENISITQDLDGEFAAAVTEVVLEGLRWVHPPLLDRKDNTNYVLAQ
jgi:magnesium chelatase subunit I